MKLRWVWLIAGIVLLDAILGSWWWRRERERSQDGPILAAAARYGVEPALIKAVVWRESWFNPRVEGRAGEAGLMQIRLPVAREWSAAEGGKAIAREQLFDPTINTRVGAWYLGKLLRRYAQADNPLLYALADYNAGRSNVLRWSQGSATTNSAALLAQITFPGVKRYVESVLERRDYYRPIFPER